MDTFGGNDVYNSFNTAQPEESLAKTSDLYGNARTAFIRKVYTILTSTYDADLVQILFTVVLTLLSIYSTGFFNFQLENTWLVFLALIGCVVIEIYVFCCNGAKQHPENIIMIGLFTLCQGYIVSFISAVTGAQSGNGIVLMAAIYTFGM